MMLRVIKFILAKVCFGKKIHHVEVQSEDSITHGNRVVTQEQIESARLIFLAVCERKEVLNHLAKGAQQMTEEISTRL